MTKKTVPNGWHDYTNVGERVHGTRFLPFKVPLKEDVCKCTMIESQWFTPTMLLQTQPDLKLIIDLTYTNSNRYYNPNDFTSKGVHIKKIKCPGGPNQVPTTFVKRFCDIVDDFLSNSNKNSLIGVHCTHGLNRTGYFICKYMVERLNVNPHKAIREFEQARGHNIERHLYKNDIIKYKR